jgi:hypothetical protein
MRSWRHAMVLSRALSGSTGYEQAPVFCFQC